MAKVVRSGVLQPGTYWVDVWRPSVTRPKVPDGEPAMQRWVAANKGNLAGLTRETHEEGTLQSPGAPFRIFYAFHVTAATTPFPVELGRPTQTSSDPAAPPPRNEDTVRKPPPEPGFLETLAATADHVERAVIVIGLIWLFSRASGRR